MKSFQILKGDGWATVPKDLIVKSFLIFMLNPLDTPSFDNHYYKQELQNTRSTLKEMKGRLTRSQINTIRSNKDEIILGVEKEKTKRLQNEREEELIENSKGGDPLYPNVERNLAGSKEKKYAQLEYGQKEKEITNRLSKSPQKDENENVSDYNKSHRKGTSFGKSFGQSENGFKDNLSGNSLRDWNTFKDTVTQKNKERFGESSQGYFTNKELVRSKYEQYEQELQRQRKRGNEKRFKLEREIQKENFVKHEYEQELENKTKELENIERENKWNKEEALEERPQERRSSSNLKEREYRSDGFQRALEKKDTRLKEDYETLEKEKSWSNRGLKYHDRLYESTGPLQEEVSSLHPEKSSIKEKILARELENLR